MLAVTTQDLSTAGEAVETVGITFPLAYDTTTSVPRRWGRFDNFGTELADAAVYVIGQDGRVAWQSLGDNYRHQVSAEEIIEQLDLLDGGDPSAALR